MTRGRNDPAVLAAVAVGGALGTLARYGVSRLVPVDPGTFPWSTFVVNLSGALVLGVVAAVVAARFPADRFLRPFVATGFLGAFTTFSTLALESTVLVGDGHPALAAGYALVSVAAGVGAAGAGLALGRRSSR